jgi:hypothetical protein
MTKKKEEDPEMNACLQQEKDCRMTEKKRS